MYVCINGLTEKFTKILLIYVLLKDTICLSEIVLGDVVRTALTHTRLTILGLEFQNGSPVESLC